MEFVRRAKGGRECLGAGETLALCDGDAVSCVTGCGWERTECWGGQAGVGVASGQM